MFKKISKILPRSVKRAGISRQINAANALELFSKVIINFFNKEIAGKIRPLYVKDGVITVASLSPATVDIIKKEEAKILEEINNSIGEVKIEKIRFIT